MISGSVALIDFSYDIGLIFSDFMSYNILLNAKHCCVLSIWILFYSFKDSGFYLKLCKLLVVQLIFLRLQLLCFY